ncbi:fimbrial protein [Serratia marcescens]|jgi:type 1 fimbria pilin|uniref:fimbrial protein n=1 Tax=Serratia TaxID=613 RepID=UPI000537B276|nr:MULTISPECIES: fimbrial protein [Serratia]MBH2640404.1 type 1 fimbrial protein [Serratia ureilytica]MBN5227434.1 type 1 fimbrial protein [Serratia ureilytica]PNO38509.1 type 1 fimbrial protein [Serratia marcescens]
MQKMDNGYSNLKGRSLARQAGMVAMLALVLLADNSAKAEDGNHGVLFVHGALTEGACRLDMVSAHQDVWLGETATGNLAKVGERTEPVAFQLRLRDCLRTGAAMQDERRGNKVWDAYQPAVSVSFNAPADADNPRLVKVRGAGGVALRLLDSDKKDVRLGHRSRPQLLAIGSDALNFYVMAERTRAPMVAGAYQAAIDFRMNYD